MGVKAMFYVNEVSKLASGPGKVKLNATAKGDYASYSKWTPTGSIEFTCLNDAATAWFETRLGRDVAITFEDPTETDLITPPS